MEETPIEEVKSNNKSKLQLAFGLILLVLVGSIVLRWLLALAVPILLFANRDIVFRMIGKIADYYREDPLKGLAATVVAFLLFTPFTIFLFLRTIYYLVSGNDFPIPDNKKTIIDITPKKEKKPQEDNEDRLMTIEEIRRKLREDDNIS